MSRRKNLLWIVLVLVGQVCVAAEKPAATKSPLQLTLPPVCYAVVGVPMSIYFDNIVLTERPADFRFTVQSDLGTAEPLRWTVTPTADQVGDHRLCIAVADGKGKQLEQGQLVVRVVPADAGKACSIRLLVVGDSLTAASLYPKEIARLLSTPDNPTWTMLGTRRSGGPAKEVGHEGYGGWTWAGFASRYEPKPDPENRKISSPFVFLKGGKPTLDVAEYFAKNCDGKAPDYITVMLGINDCFSAKSDDPAAMDAKIGTMFGHAEKLLAAFRKAAPRATIGVCLTTPPNARESGFEANYKGKHHRWDWKQVQHRLVQRQLEHFAGREKDGIFIIPTELNLDPQDGYPVNNGVHPNPTGYQQIGASVYAWLKDRLQAAKGGRK
jgi:lysophospholipase L1-like esterase